MKSFKRFKNILFSSTNTLLHSVAYVLNQTYHGLNISVGPTDYGIHVRHEH